MFQIDSQHNEGATIRNARMKMADMPRSEPLRIVLDDECSIVLFSYRASTAHERHHLDEAIAELNGLRNFSGVPGPNCRKVGGTVGHYTCVYGERYGCLKYTPTRGAVPVYINDMLARAKIWTGVAPAHAQVSWLPYGGFYMPVREEDADMLKPGAPTIMMAMGMQRQLHIERRDTKKYALQVDLIDGTVVMMCGKFHERYTHEIPAQPISEHIREPDNARSMHYNIIMRYYRSQDEAPELQLPDNYMNVVNWKGRLMRKRDIPPREPWELAEIERQREKDRKRPRVLIDPEIYASTDCYFE